MGLETGTYIGDLNSANPPSTDPKSQGDDHLRLIKSALLNTFAGVQGMIYVSGTEAQGATENDYVITVSPAPAAYTSFLFLAFKATHANTGAATIKINSLLARTIKAIDGSPMEAGDIENGAVVVLWYDGTDFFLISGNDRAARAGDTYTGTHDFSNATQVVLPAATSIGNVSGTELAQLDGVTGNVQSQINDRAIRTGDTYTGTHNFVAAVVRVLTQAQGDNSDKAANTAYVDQAVMNAAAGSLPTSPGILPGYLLNDGSNVRWFPVVSNLLFLNENSGGF